MVWDWFFNTNAKKNYAVQMRKRTLPLDNKYDQFLQVQRYNGHFLRNMQCNVPYIPFIDAKCFSFSVTRFSALFN